MADGDALGRDFQAGHIQQSPDDDVAEDQADDAEHDHQELNRIIPRQVTQCEKQPNGDLRRHQAQG